MKYSNLYQRTFGQNVFKFPNFHNTFSLGVIIMRQLNNFDFQIPHQWLTRDNGSTCYPSDIPDWFPNRFDFYFFNTVSANEKVLWKLGYLKTFCPNVRRYKLLYFNYLQMFTDVPSAPIATILCWWQVIFRHWLSFWHCYSWDLVPKIFYTLLFLLLSCPKSINIRLNYQKY